jgi:archaellum biogenesis ATPase FlaH
MLRHQQQFGFFDPDKVADGAIRFVNLSSLALETDLGGVLQSLIRETATINPSVVVVDSFRTVTPSPARRYAVAEFCARSRRASRQRPGDHVLGRRVR